VAGIEQPPGDPAAHRPETDYGESRHAYRRIAVTRSPYDSSS
jgi:hypothetical protein